MPVDRVLQRSIRLVSGVCLMGLSLAALINADLGVNPWTALSQGVSRHVGLSIGTITVITSVVVTLTWAFAGPRPGIATVVNAACVGPAIDLGLAVVPTPDRLPAQLVLLAASIAGVAAATGLYISAGWGPGPRDGLMTAAAARGAPIAVARWGIEGAVLGVGWALGATVGLGTAGFAIAIGPLVAYALPRMALASAPVSAAHAGRAEPVPGRGRRR